MQLDVKITYSNFIFNYFKFELFCLSLNETHCNKKKDVCSGGARNVNGGGRHKLGSRPQFDGGGVQMVKSIKKKRYLILGRKENNMWGVSQGQNQNLGE